MTGRPPRADSQPPPDPAPDPARTLDRIAYLLERSGAPVYRVRAFRTAAAVVRRLDPAHLAARAGAGTLTEIKGIGATTAQVVTEVLAGTNPAYLTHLQDEVAAAGGDPQAEEDPAVQGLLDKIQGDCHSHSDWSDGGSPISTMAEAAKALGRRYLALTDHSPRLTVANGLSTDRLLRQLDVVAQLNEELQPFRLLTGIEVDINEDGTLDQADEILDRLDVVVASVHSKLRMDSGPMTERMLRAVANPRVDILGHCTGRIVVGKGRPPSTFDADAVFEAAAANHTAVEINSRPERLDPPDELLALAATKGCVFTIDSDAHAPGQLEFLVNGARKAVACGIEADRILTTWDADRLLAHTRTQQKPD